MSQLLQISSLPLAVLALQSPTCAIDERLNSLRFLQNYVQEQSQLNSGMRSRINQLILDNILRLIMGEDRSADLRKRQLVRTECFLMLSNLLTSECLFGSSKSQLEEMLNLKIDEPSYETSGDGEALFTEHLTLKSNTKLDDFLSASNREYKVESPSPWSLPPTSSVGFPSSRSRGSTPTAVGRVKSKGDLENDQLKRLIQKIVKDEDSPGDMHKKYLKPRVSMVYGATYVEDRVIPNKGGRDVTSWQQQDKLLGYQKYRTWFPIASQPMSSQILPKERAKTAGVGPNTVLEEFLRMRSMMTYVGDLVMPRRDISTATGFPKAKKGERQYVDTGGYASAMKDAVSIWTPILGAHLPVWAKPKALKVAEAVGRVGAYESGPLLQSASCQGLSSMSPPPSRSTTRAITAQTTEYGAPLVQRPPRQVEAKPTGTADTTRNVIITKGVLRRLLQNELFCRDQTKQTLRRTLDDLTYKERFGAVLVKGHQDGIQNALEAEATSVRASALALQSLMRETIKLQYAAMPARYLLVIEGAQAKANPRKIMTNAFRIFWRVRIKNLLSLAWGIWMIHVVKARSAARMPKYAKFCAMHMMRLWMDNLKLKRQKIWLYRWCVTVTRLIFNERNRGALPVQCLYRRWRDRRKFLALNAIACYNGPLSDIYLAPQRTNIRFTIPHTIRESRRMYWLAAVIIQKYYRRINLWRAYRESRRKILLIQSLLRMYPKMVQYRRLKRVTIKCQAWMRRTLFHRRFKILKAATIVVQRYVRGYRAVLLKFRLFDQKWSVIEERTLAVIRIQCRWRIFFAKKTLRRKRLELKFIEWAALVLQRNWYRYKEGFHTFVLMCAYRVQDDEDRALTVRARNLGRFHASRKIQREYKQHYFKRIVSAVVKSQCWFRGRLGYQLVDILRYEKWAARKLHHWARVRMKYRHNFAKRIAFKWLRYKSGRLLRHLRAKARALDVLEDDRVHEMRYRAASVIQGMVRGVLARRWVLYTRAALKIQKPLRAWLTKRRYIRRGKERLRAVASAFVTNVLSRAVTFRTRFLVKLHSKMLIRPQTMIRMYLKWLTLKRSREFAFKYGLAVVKVQRFWRNTGAIARASQDVLALKRMDRNPFRRCDVLHTVVCVLYPESNRFFNIRDPRLGMRTFTFLYRIGLTDMYPMFPKKDYPTVTELKRLTMDKLLGLYQQWQSRRDKSKDGPKSTFGKSASVPKTTFAELLKVLGPSMPPRRPADLAIVRSLFAVPEVFDMAEFEAYVIQKFIKKFGAGYIARAQNLAKMLLDREWTNYNNHKSVGKCLTSAQIVRSITLAQNPSEVKPVLDVMQSVSFSNEEQEWEATRYQQCLQLVQAAVDRMKYLLPAGPILPLLEQLSARESNYRRKMKYIIARMKRKMQPKSKSVDSPSKMIANRQPSLESIVSFDEVSSQADADMGQLGYAMSALDAMRRDFCGTQTEVELELNVSLCKLYMESLESVVVADRGINTLKLKWRYRQQQRVKAQERVKRFLMLTQDRYLADRRLNKVEVTWKRISHKEAIQRKMEDIALARRRRLARIDHTLNGIAQYGWQEVLGDYGYPVWVNKLKALKEPLMPRYSTRHFELIIRVQNKVRRFINKMAEHRRYKAELAARQKAIENEAWEKEMRRGQRLVSVSVTVTDETLINRYLETRASVGEPSRVSVSSKTSASEPGGKAEESTGTSVGSSSAAASDPLPYWLRFENFKTKADMWAIYISEDESSYEICYVFRVRKAGKVCDVRTVHDVYHRNVSTTRVVHVRLAAGSEVEARYKGEWNFYRGVVTNVHDTLSGRSEYTILYDDGEREVKVPREYIRSTKKAIDTFLLERSKYRRYGGQETRRLGYYQAIKDNRSKSRRKFISVNFDAILSQVEKSRASLDSDTASVSTAVASISSAGGSATSSSYSIATEPDEKARLESILKSLPILRPISYRMHTKIIYAKAALRYPWIEKTLASGKTYANPVTKESTLIPPLYTSDENFYARKIQSLWFVRVAKKRFKQILWSQPPVTVARNAVEKYQKSCFIGFQLEGATLSFLLRRAGFFELAEVLEDYNKAKPGALKGVKIDQLAKLPVDKYRTIGVLLDPDCKRLQKFQDWWTKTPDDTRTTLLGFLNYYSSYSDPRDISSCIRDSYDAIHARILKAFSKNASRVTSMCDKLVKSQYPITRQQLETFLRKYEGKAAFAQDSIGELVDKQTTHSWTREKDAYRELRAASRRIGILLKNMSIAGLTKRMRESIEKAEEIMKQAQGLDPANRPAVSGPEAKAALLLRTEVVGLMVRCENAALIIQTQCRGLIYRHRWNRIVQQRRRNVLNLQRFCRGLCGRRQAHNLREQQWARWEQLWDDRHQCMYYYNIDTKVSTYETPAFVYRPMVRHMRTLQLIQAWPFLDSDPAYGRIGVPSLTVLMCSVCNIRKAIRICDVCLSPPSPMTYTEKAAFCFPCFTKKHFENIELQEHTYRDITEPMDALDKVEFLKCAECDEPATRQCLGILDDFELDALCERLSKMPCDSWRAVLLEANIGGERKIELLLSQIQLDNTSSGGQSEYLTSVQLQAVRSALERTRAECDECYCTSCYLDVHAGGKRSTHRWRGFQPNAPVCVVCSRSIAEIRCRDCGDSIYCGACFRVFHGKGRKRKHNFSLVLENIDDDQIFCQICTRRAATETCDGCGHMACESCHEFKHKRNCPANEPPEAVDDNPMPVCVSCGEKADQRCAQCGDDYCSNTWMGNPGCFAKLHHKGNRLNHVLEELPVWIPTKKKKGKQKSKMAKQKKSSATLSVRSKSPDKVSSRSSVSLATPGTRSVAVSR